MCSKPSIPVIALTVVFGTGILFVAIGYTHRPPAQDDDKLLDIERYPHEPLELVDLKVSEQSVKSKIKVKLRRGRHGLDDAKFKDKSDWFKRVSVRLKNVSGKPIVGLSAYMYFKPPGSKVLFSLGLFGSTQLKRGVLEPNDEINLTVSDQSWNQTANILMQYGVDANLSSVTLFIESVLFSDGLRWSKGQMLRRDPDNPNKWISIDKGPLGVSKLSHPAQFAAVVFKPSMTQPRTNAQCVENNRSYTADHCSQIYCFSFTDLGGSLIASRL